MAAKEEEEEEQNRSLVAPLEEITGKFPSARDDSGGTTTTRCLIGAGANVMGNPEWIRNVSLRITKKKKNPEHSASPALISFTFSSR